MHFCSLSPLDSSSGTSRVKRYAGRCGGGEGPIPLREKIRYMSSGWHFGGESMAYSLPFLKLSITPFSLFKLHPKTTICPNNHQLTGLKKTHSPVPCPPVPGLTKLLYIPYVNSQWARVKLHFITYYKILTNLTTFNVSMKSQLPKGFHNCNPSIE